MNHQFSSLHNIHSENSYISSDAYLQHSTLCEVCYYHRSDAIFFKRKWRGSLHQSLVKNSFKGEKGNLLLGHSDQMTSVGKVLLLRFLGYRNVTGINVVKFKDISIPLPIGITNNTNESDYHRLFGNNELIMKANQVDFLTQSNGLVYGCFSTETNPGERMPLAKLLSQSKHIFDEPEFSIQGRVRYLENLRKYAFTACPVGNGIDTHRLWETLYMGGTPVVKRHPMMEALVSDLPVILLDDWNHLTDQKGMEKLWQVAKSKDNFNKLNLSFWLKKLKALNEI